MKLYKQAKKYGAQVVLVGGILASTAAHAVIDTTAVTTAITDSTAAIAVIGAAVLVLAVGVATWSWLKKPIK